MMLQMADNKLSVIVTAVLLHSWSLLLLSFCYSRTAAYPRISNASISAVQAVTIFSGLTAGIFTLGVPYILPIEDPLVDCPARVVCFFYGCKILDLAAARARQPPVLIEAGQSIALATISKRFQYSWLLLTETRYSAFDVAIQQRERMKQTPNAWTFGPALTVLLLVCLVPSPETKSLMALLVIQAGLESLHALLHPLCPDYLFWQPFAASSLTSFWRTHWHAGAETFLRSLAYIPGRDVAKKLGCPQQLARAAGVMAAFNLTGIWHGWATAALATRPWMVGVRVWGLFVGMGLGVVMEGAMPRRWRGTLPHRLFVWIFFISVGLHILTFNQQNNQAN
jgi:hypothetical protein